MNFLWVTFEREKPGRPIQSIQMPIEQAYFPVLRNPHGFDKPEVIFQMAARDRACIRSAHSLRNYDFIFRLFFCRDGIVCAGLRMSGTAIFVEEVIDPRTRAFQRAIRRRNVNLQQLKLIRRLCAIIHLHPDARLLRYHFALALIGTAAWTVSKLLGASLRTYMLHVAEYAIAAFLAAKHRRLH